MSKVLHILKNDLRNVSSLDYNIARYMALLIAVGSALRLSFNIGYNYSVFKNLEGNHVGCCVNFLESYLIPITAGLILTAIGLGVKKPAGFFLSLLTLTLVGGFYILWYLGTLSIMREYQARDFSQLARQQQYLLPLYEASWWDLIVIAVTVTLFLWHIKTLWMIRRSARSTI